jgi:hypothetical protein
LNCKPLVDALRESEHQKEISMADDRSERPVDPHVSPYLRWPLRTLKEAKQDNDASAHPLISLPSPPHPASRPVQD